MDPIVLEASSNPRSMFLVERRLPNAGSAELAILQATIAFACSRLTRRGKPIRSLGSTFLPGQARLLTLFEADSAETVREVNENVHAPFLAIEPAIGIDPRPHTM